jgi:serine/threonine-protein kinase
VIRQDPEPFTAVPLGFKVTLYVSSGKVKLPDVRGKTFDDAEAALNPNFTNIVQGAPIQTSDQSKDGLVAQESPTPGDAYPTSQQVTLRLYHFVAPPTTSCPTGPPSTTGPSGAPATGSPSTC